MKSMRQILKEIREIDKQPEFELRPQYTSSEKKYISPAGEQISAEIWRRNQKDIGKRRQYLRLNKELDHIVSLMKSAFTQELRKNYSKHPAGGSYFFRGIPSFSIDITPVKYPTNSPWWAKIHLSLEYEELGITSNEILRYHKIEIGDHMSFNIDMYYRLKKLIEQFHSSGLFRHIQIQGYPGTGFYKDTTLEDHIKQLTLLFLPFLEQHYGKNIKPEVLSGVKKQRDFGF